MAELRLNSFYWWISDDKFSWIANSFQEWIWLNVKDNPLSLRLNAGGTNTVISWTVVSDIFYNGLLYLITSSWNLYRYNSNWTYTQLRTDLWSNVTNAVLFGQYIYILSSSILIRYIDKDSLTSSSQTLATNFINSDANKRQFVIFKDGLYISDKNSLFRINIDNSVNAELLQLEQNEVVKSLSISSDYIKIYSDNWSITTVSYCSFVDNVWTINESKQWKGINILFTSQFNSLDYIFTSDWIYISQWFNKEKIKDVSSIWWTNANVLRNNIYFINNDQLASWWNLNKDYPQVLNNDINIDWSYIATAGDNIFVCRNNNIYRYNLIWNDFQTTWTLKSRTYVWETVITTKSSTELHVWYTPLQTWTSIEIKLYKDLSTTPIKTILINNVWSVFNKSNISIDFNLVEVEITLKWNWTNTPELLDLLLIYTNNSR